MISTAAATSGREIPRHFAPLDGLRGVAILAVVVAHIMEWTYGAAWWGWRGMAENGVLLFFVLSGFLITSIMFREEAAHRRVDLRAFYMRRALRLLPALILYVGTVAVLKRAGLIRHESWISVLAALAYLRNIFGHGPALGHLWSLSLEEQFYLTWPVLFVLSGRRRLSLIVTILVGMAIWRGGAIALHLTNVVDGHVYSRPWFRYDSILYGCFVAALRQLRPVGPTPEGAWRILALTVGLSLVAAASAIEMGSALMPVQVTLASIGMTALLWYAVTCRAGDPSYAILASRPLVFLGKISYSLYLWQGLFIELPSPALGEKAWSRLHSFPLNLVLALLAAVGSHYLLERPFLRLKRRFERATLRLEVAPAPPLG
ncbi:MAG TPA: acyltransferase [Polyangia bacterium]|nr:acyltransferase [Polyangia bacterium]